jgi:hypothetical protein
LRILLADFADDFDANRDTTDLGREGTRAARQATEIDLQAVAFAYTRDADPRHLRQVAEGFGRYRFGGPRFIKRTGFVYGGLRRIGSGSGTSGFHHGRGMALGCYPSESRPSLKF